MKKYLISPDKKQYKANLHCHTVLSDGKKTPEEVVEAYKSHGYGILAITDHERPVEHQHLADENFILITGYECYIRPDPNGKYDVYAPEVHLNLFAEDPKNISMVCFNDHYSRYLKRDNALEGLVKVGSERPREYTTEYINEYIKTAKENGYIVAYNHPYWSMESEESLLSYEGLFSIEVCNWSSFVMNGLEHNGAVYDRLLTAGKRIFCHGADDNHNAKPWDHPGSDSFGGFTMIMPEQFTYSSVIDAMKNGEMYSSMGPEIYEVSVEDGKLHLECSEVYHAFLYVGSKTPKYIHAFPGEPITSADFDIDENARYIRVSVCDDNGKWADTRGFFPEEYK